MKRTPEQLEVEPTWKKRLARYLAKVAWRNLPFAVAALLATIALAKVGADPYAVIQVMFVGSPVLAVAVVSFVVHAWRQNSVTAIASDDRPDAEPASHVGQAKAGQVANPASRTTVASIEVLPLPTGPVGGQPTVELGGHHPIPLGYRPDPGRVAIAKAGEPSYVPRVEDTDAH